MSGVKDHKTDLELGESEEALARRHVRNSDSNNTLSSRNLELHDSETVMSEPAGHSLDLDQTTMIGSALDLDSLDGDGGSESAQHVTDSSISAHRQQQESTGSQIGLLKLSAVWQQIQRPSKKSSMLRKGAGSSIKVLKISNPCDEVWQHVDSSVSGGGWDCVTLKLILVLNLLKTSINYF